LTPQLKILARPTSINNNQNYKHKYGPSQIYLKQPKKKIGPT